MFPTSLYPGYVQLYFLVFLLIAVPVQSALLYNFIKKRNTTLMAARHFSLNLMGSIFLMIYDFLEPMKHLFSATWPCFLEELEAHMVLETASNACVLRLILLYVNFRVSRAKLHFKARTKLEKWLMENQQVFSEKRILIILFSLSCIGASAPLFNLFDTNFRYATEMGIFCRSMLLNLIYLGWTLTMVVVIGIFLYLMLDFQDSFFIKRELGYIGILALAAFVPHFVAHAFNSYSDFHYQVFPVTSFTVTFFLFSTLR